VITINLTDEQAEFLAKRMRAVLSDAHWAHASVAGDTAEHAQTILTKITREQSRNRW
jgi:hypothetical protein